MAATEVRADPVVLVRLADQVLRASQQIADAWRGAQADLARGSAGAFGDLGSASADAHQRVVEAADLALGRLVGVLEIDSDLLYQVAVAYEQADEKAATQLSLTPV